MYLLAFPRSDEGPSRRGYGCRARCVHTAATRALSPFSRKQPRSRCNCSMHIGGRMENHKSVSLHGHVMTPILRRPSFGRHGIVELASGVTPPTLPGCGYTPTTNKAPAKGPYSLLMYTHTRARPVVLHPTPTRQFNASRRKTVENWCLHVIAQVPLL